ncbi:MAG: helix-turn-helix transcriptional regulator [Alphaproteobacteria bacterium]|nr:helix-turn-helix transcriptional regulator [Alphaproteobacteria bacterium]
MSDEEKDLLALGNEIRRHRNLKGLSQEKLAELAGLNRNYIGFVERAERSPRVTVIFRIARALEIHPSELIREMKWALR